MHGASPCDAISLTRRLDRLREDLEKDPTLLQKKVKQYFLDNPHRLTLIMRPGMVYCSVHNDCAFYVPWGDILHLLIRALFFSETFFPPAQMRSITTNRQMKKPRLLNP